MPCLVFCNCKTTRFNLTKYESDLSLCVFLYHFREMWTYLKSKEPKGELRSKHTFPVLNMNNKHYYKDFSIKMGLCVRANKHYIPKWSKTVSSPSICIIYLLFHFYDCDILHSWLYVAFGKLHGILGVDGVWWVITLLAKAFRNLRHAYHIHFMIICDS